MKSERNGHALGAATSSIKNLLACSVRLEWNLLGDQRRLCCENHARVRRGQREIEEWLAQTYGDRPNEMVEDMEILWLCRFTDDERTAGVAGGELDSALHPRSSRILFNLG